MLGTAVVNTGRVRSVLVHFLAIARKIITIVVIGTKLQMTLHTFKRQLKTSLFHDEKK